METKEKTNISFFSSESNDKSENKINPILSMNKTNKHNKNIFRYNKSLNIEKLKNEKRFDFLKPELENNKEYFIYSFYRNDTINGLLKLNIDLTILEAIYNSKNILIRNMKLKDRHGDGLIPKFEFLSIFYNTNCHFRLRIELIEKIVNTYINSDSNIIMVNYLNLINLLCLDIKKIIDKNNLLIPINKYLSPNYNRINGKKRIGRNYKNNFSDSNSLLNSFQDLPKLEEFNIKDIINKINNISSELSNCSDKNFSLEELQSILEKEKIYINKNQLNQLLNFLGIKNPNSFILADFIEKVRMNSKDLYKTTISHNNFRLKNINKEKANDRYNKTINSGFLSNKSKKIFQFKNKPESKKFNINNNIKIYQTINKDNNISKYNIENNLSEESKQNKINEEKLKNDELVVKCIKEIQNKIYELQYKVDLISDYFDIILSYNIFRLENVISLDEFDKVLKYEKFNFSKKEIKLLFSFIDSKKDGLIDRIEFIEAIKNVPYPVSTIQNYILLNNLSIIDLAYKMEIDLYFTPLNDVLNTKFNMKEFQTKIKLINPIFNRNFSYSLFKAINGKSKEISLQKIFEVFNIKKDYSYKDLYLTRNEISNRCIRAIFYNISYFEIREKLYNIDKYLTGIISLNLFIKTIKEMLKEKIAESDLLNFLRMNKLIDKDNNVNFRDFIYLIYLDRENISEIFYKCLETFMKYLKEECGNDLYVAFVKLNNVNNNLGMKENIDEDKLYKFFQARNNFITFPKVVVKKFDFDKDGKISQDDLKNIIINYVDKDFFIDKKKIEEEKHKAEKNKLFDEISELFINLKQFLKENNLTIDKLFCYLDENKDNYIDKNEFIYQMNSLPDSFIQKFSQEKIEQFFNYFDELKNKKIDFNIFKNKYNFLNENVKLNKERIYIGNTKIEKLILNEFAKYYIDNIYITDIELFTLLDKDHDGIISKEDLKYFCINLLNMNENEITFDKLLHFISCISENKDENLTLSDIQKLMKDIRNNDLNKYIKTINNFCNESISVKNIDSDWIKDIIDIIGMHISQEYDSDIQKFYDNLNVTSYTNKGQGLSFQNIVHFFETNYLLFESFHMNNDKYLAVFNYLSNGGKFITLNDLNKTFYNYDYFGWMHRYITNFLIENFTTSIDAFKYFFKVKTFKDETSTSNGENKNRVFITEKEFVNGILNLFPNKFKINTITHYYSKIFKKNGSLKLNSNDKETTNIIKFVEFNRIYFSNNLEDSKNKNLRIGFRHSFYSTSKIPFKVKLHKKLRTAYDLDSLDKIKRLIKSSKVDFKSEFNKFMKKTGGKANIFQIKNMIRSLGLGLSNLEIEDIMNKSGLLTEGYINLMDFYNYITSETPMTIIYKKNIIEAMKDLKQLIIKYYTNPKLAFQFNDTSNKKLMDFETFKKIVIDLYKREYRSYPPPPYSLIKSMFDFIDIRKDSIIDLNEWNKTFCEFEGKLDCENDKNNNLKKWETSNDIFEIYKLIAKNHKIIKEKVIEHSLNEDCTIIHADNLINILKEVLPKVYLSHTQWRMIVSLGEEISFGLINYEVFIKIIRLSSKISKSHMKK